MLKAETENSNVLGVINSNVLGVINSNVLGVNFLYAINLSKLLWNTKGTIKKHFFGVR